MSKYKQIIIFKSESKKKEIVEAHKSQIIDYIKDFIESCFDFSLKLHVVIRDIDSDKHFIDGGYVNGYMSWKKRNTFLLCLNSKSFERMEYDEGLDLAIVITHELGHIYDLYHVMNNKYYKINPIRSKQKYIDSYVIKQGWNFWTEFTAYYFTFKEFKDLFDYPTLHQIVVMYQKIVEQYNILQVKMEARERDADDLFQKHLNDVEQFIYIFSKYLAGCIRGKRRYYKIKVNKNNEKAIKDIYRIRQKLLRLVSELFTNTYGKGMARKLYNIGDYIIRTFYAKYNIYPAKHRGYFALAYYYKK